MHDFIIGAWAMRAPIAFALVMVVIMVIIDQRDQRRGRHAARTASPGYPGGSHRATPPPLARRTRDLLSWDNGKGRYDTEIDPD